ncbi:hypothetical protein BJ138DRAFT_413194 [Hygrophoropsis aurantiaca]|uniref:Uncharacterized protein n=1 Tax=Hygrophoropsis aurantiaca TaxID=72124 RepID=A0ACB8A427_9AGAM|nr:hypothetical protein BJ138DRAFT_413194 [Hygrophoropsis aurantiaca]
MYRRFSTVIITLLLSEFKKCWAQQGTSCPASAGYSWAANDMGQDPCVVAHSLFVPQPCNDEYVFFGPLTAGSDDVYPAPSDDTVGPCLCNTVIYSLATACATCQDASFLSWSEWIVNCPASDVVQQSWPTSIPSNTAIPAWAYLPIVVSRTPLLLFNLTRKMT